MTKNENPNAVAALVLLAVAVTGCVLSLWVVYGAPAAPSRTAPSGTLPAVELPVVKPPPGAPSARSLRSGQAGGGATLAQVARTAVPAQTSAEARRQRRAAADKVRAKLLAFWQEQAAQSEPQPEAPAFERMPAREGEGNQADKPLRKYIKKVFREQFAPMAGSCYDELLERDPEAAGSITIELTLSGAASVGGVVESVEIGEGATLTDESLITCIRESSYALVLDAPPEDNRSMTVKYPFSLSPEEPDDAPAEAAPGPGPQSD